MFITKNTKRRAVPVEYFEALLRKVLRAGPLVNNGCTFTTFAMVDGDFMPTQNMAEVRFIAWDNSLDYGLFQVNANGEAIALYKKDN